MATRQHSVAPIPATDGLTVIGQGIHVHGEIHGEEDLRIEGRVEGGISLTETVHVAASGIVVATIVARDVIVSGVVVGNVSASNSVNLEPGAKLVGDINAPRIIIADGAAFRGNVAMGEGASLPAPTRTRTAVSRGTLASRSRGTTTAAAPVAKAKATKPEPRVAPAARTPERTAPRVAAIRPPAAPRQDHDDVTVIVRHAALAEDEGSGSAVKKKTAKKAPPRGRVPKPGKRRVNRR